MSIEKNVFMNCMCMDNRIETNLNTLRTRIVAGELTTDSLRLADRSSGGSSRGLLDADVAIAKAAAAVDVLLL